jgi:hypothetical protein
LKIIHCTYENAVATLNNIIDGKTGYDQIIQNNLEDKLTNERKKDILNRTADRHFYDEVPHTAILMDDAFNVFKRKGSSAFQDLLFRNRQPRFTIFLCVQDPYNIPVAIRRNIDSLWLFGGFKDENMFKKLMGQFSTGGTNKQEAWEQYLELSVYDVMQFNIRPNGMEIVIINREDGRGDD